MNRNRILQALLPLAVVALAATACSDDQKRALGEEDVRDSLRASVEHVVDDAGTTLGDDLECTSSIDTDGTVTGSCDGATADGDAVAAAYAGTADVDAESCTADMTVTVGDAPPTTATGVDCFAT
jgi:hypothetical protein